MKRTALLQELRCHDMAVAQNTWPLSSVRLERLFLSHAAMPEYVLAQEDI